MSHTVDCQQYDPMSPTLAPTWRWLGPSFGTHTHKHPYVQEFETLFRICAAMLCLSRIPEKGLNWALLVANKQGLNMEKRVYSLFRKKKKKKKKHVMSFPRSRLKIPLHRVQKPSRALHKVRLNGKQTLCAGKLSPESKDRTDRAEHQSSTWPNNAAGHRQRTTRWASRSEQFRATLTT